MSVAPATEPAGAVSRPDSPYVGLVPYEVSDAAFFFGRSLEAAIVAANLRAARLTIVYGAERRRQELAADGRRRPPPARRGAIRR